MSELNKNSTFFNKIEKNSTICKNCYRKVKSYSKPHHTMPDVVTSYVEHENHVGHHWVDDNENSGRPSVKRTYCKCGNIDDAKIRPLGNRKLMQIAQRIEKRLSEMDIDFDQDVFYTYIRQNKNGSDIQFNEEKYFETAIEKSIVTDE